jgi:hypothetical protein
MQTAYGSSQQGQKQHQTHHTSDPRAYSHLREPTEQQGKQIKPPKFTARCTTAEGGKL